MSRPRPRVILASVIKDGRGSVLIAAAMVLVQLTASFHGMLVRHVTCEHGELVDAGAERSPSAGVINTQAVAPASTVLAESDDASSLSLHCGHEHCLVQTLRRAQALSPALGALAMARSDSAQPVDRELGFGAVCPALYRLAPKHSPPA